MKYLLDTHVFVWALTEDRRLSSKYRAVWSSPESDLSFSVASVWEMLIKSGLGKLSLPAGGAAWILKEMQVNRINLLPIRPLHLSALEDLPPLHRDPFDRMLVSQAIAEGMTVLSADKTLRKYAARFL